MNVRTSKQGRATIIMTFDIHGTEELDVYKRQVHMVMCWGVQPKALKNILLKLFYMREFLFLSVQMIRHIV